MSPFFVILTLAVGAGGAHALGLGEISQQSALGAPLRVAVPVLAESGEALSGECVRLVSSGQRVDGMPEVLQARLTLERSASGARVVIASPRSVTDPVLKLTLQVGCEGGGVRREYTMLMDPVPIEIPAAPSVASVPVPAQAPAATSSAPAVSRVAPAPAARAGSAKSGKRSSAKRGPTTAVGAAASASPAGAKQAAIAAAKRPRSGTAPAMVAAAPAPKLSVSAGAPVETATAPNVGTPASGINANADPAARALDNEAAALQRRVVELTAMVDRMQAEVRAAEAAQAAQAARFEAEKAALTAPPATVGRWWNDAWPFLVGVFAVAALIAAFLSLRRRESKPPRGMWQPSHTVPQKMTVRQPTPAAAVTQPQPWPAVATAASKSPAATVPSPSSQLDVAEPSHVTEEAGVYLAFNRPERAVEVLQEHIRTTPHSLPAAWLMLLDLYHQQGREAEFRELAQRFHSQFNAQQPSWEAYRQQAQNDHGVEGFQHVIRQVTASWGKAECRDYLDHLLRENRDGRRMGFSLEAYEDIVFLRQLAEVLAAGPDARTRSFNLAPVRPLAPPPVPAPPKAVATVTTVTPKAKRPPTLDLELALDEEMLDSRKRTRGAAAAPDKPKRA